MYLRLIEIQNQLLELNPGLLPLAAFVFSALSSWHCAIMCGPMIGKTTAQTRSRLLATRVIGYTLAGGAFGFFGSTLRDSLELKIIGGVAFFVFAAVAVFCVLPFAFPSVIKFSPTKALQGLRGFGWAFMPCHLLMFFYGIAILSSSPIAGALILFGHAVMSTPALAYTNSLLSKFKKLPKSVGLVVKIAMVSLVVFNLFYFWGILIGGEAESKGKLLFCF